MLSIPGFGRRCLVDVLAAIDSTAQPEATAWVPATLEDELSQLLSTRPERRTSRGALLDRAIAVIAAKLPASETEVQRRLIAAHLARSPVELARIERAARFRDQAMPFSVLRRDGMTVVLPPARLALATTIYGLAVRAVGTFGVALVRRLAFQANSEDLPFVTALLTARDSFRWLDRAHGWFWFTSERSGLLRAIEKVLHVSSPLSVPDLSQALFRRWAPDNVPSRRALLELCRQVPRFAMSGTTVALAEPNSSESPLSQHEHTLVELFHRFGPRILGHRLHEIGAGTGLGSGLLGRYLRTSPFVLEPQPGVFRLVGS